VKLDPEERIIAAALDQAELDDASERGAGARIEFKPEGHAKVTITISRELVEQARALDLTTGELFAEAIPVGHPWRVRVSPPTFPAVALTDLRDANGTGHNRWSRALVSGDIALRPWLARARGLNFAGDRPEREPERLGTPRLGSGGAFCGRRDNGLKINRGVAEEPAPALSRDHSANALLGELARISKHDLRLPVVIADLLCHTDALAAE
jgi:hypothetical protein